MGRIVKSPDVRRTELVEAAEQLFIEKGFEETSVSDIVKKVHVAQGTFYYYFRSKDDVLDEIVDRIMDDIVDIMDVVMNNDELNAVQKIFRLFSLSRAHRKKFNGRERLVDLVHDEKHELMHLKLAKKNTPLFEGFFERIIRQGVDEGIFNTAYPAEASIAIVALMNAVGHKDKMGPELTDSEKIDLFKAFMDIMERILGTDKDVLAEIYKMVEEYE